MRALLIVLALTVPTVAGLPVGGEDDAGSGGDAGETPPFSVPVARGVLYDGDALPLLDVDLYRFEGVAGERVLLLVEGVGVCMDLVTPEGEFLAGACDTTEALPAQGLAVLPTTGAQYLRVASIGSPTYRFGLDLLRESPLQDDAGTGRDAPDFPVDRILVEAGVAYEGTVTTTDVDVYAFDAQAGATHVLVVDGAIACLALLDAAGEELAFECAGGTSSGETDPWTAPATGRYYVEISSAAVERYRFGVDIATRPRLTVDLEAGAHPARGTDPTCGTGAPVVATSGEGAELDGLVFAALKTGFRAVVAWSTPEPVVASLSYALDGGASATVRDLTARTEHVFVLDLLPQGATLCFTPEGGDAHAIRLANAMTDRDPATGVHTTNLLALANTQMTRRDAIETSMPRFADILRDMTDGHVRIGKVVLVYVDLEKEHLGVNSCYPALVHAAPCSHLADVVYTYDSCATGAACTTLLGVRDREYHVWMSSVWQANAAVDVDDEGSVLAHEMGHYLLGADDVYPPGTTVGGESPDCVDPALDLSVMSARRGMTELDDEIHRCPNEAILEDYVPSWTLFRRAYPTVPARDAIDPGPHGPGDAFALHVFAHVEPAPDVAPLLETAEADEATGGDAPDEPDPAARIAPRVVYDGRAPGLDRDHYALEARAGQALDVASTGIVCTTIFDADGHMLDADCDSDVITHTRIVLPEDGTYYLEFELAPTYRFQFALDQPATVPLA